MKKVFVLIFFALSASNVVMANDSIPHPIILILNRDFNTGAGEVSRAPLRVPSL